MSLLKFSLPYVADSTQLFARIAHKPWAILLDSGQPHSQYGRYDVMVADPFITITSGEDDDGVFCEVTENGLTKLLRQDAFSVLNQVLSPYLAAGCALPFTGGAVGYFSYDLARQIEQLPQIAQPTPAVPHMKIGIYDWAVIVDHREKSACLVSNGFHKQTHKQWPALCKLFAEERKVTQSAPFEVLTPVTSNMDFAQYSKAFDKVKRYISEGDCYQVNLAQRFSAKARGDSWQAYKKLKELSPAPFQSYMNFGDFQVLSDSPERFLQVTGKHVETRPIKGTRPRSDNPEQDTQYATELKVSVKDRAENLMIVDLLRNDIGKSCEIGSVKADKLFQLQSFANVHHLVSIVTGKLAQGKTAIDLLKGCFPGGSITGAPKLRSMQIIEELEPHRRGVYCGAIGYIGFDGNMDTNIAIRTATFADGEVSFFAGGGIVADSQLEKEYAETLDKASSMLKTMQYFSRL